MVVNSNASLLARPSPPAVSITLLSLALIIGLPGNLFVVWTIIFRVHRRSVTSLLILQQNSTCTVQHPSDGHQVFQYSLETIAAFLLPFSVLASSYCCIARKLAVGRSRWRRRVQEKTNRLIVLIVANFLVMWAPYHLLNVLQVGAVLAGSPGFMRHCLRTRPILIALAFLSSSINPLLYACAGSAFARSSGLHCITRLLEGATTVNHGSRKEDSQDPPEGAEASNMELQGKGNTGKEAGQITNQGKDRQYR